VRAFSRDSVAAASLCSLREPKASVELAKRIAGRFAFYHENESGRAVRESH